MQVVPIEIEGQQDFFAEVSEEETEAFGAGIAALKVKYVEQFVREQLDQGASHVFIGVKRIKTAERYAAQNWGVPVSLITGPKYPTAEKRDEALLVAAGVERGVTVATMDSVGIGINLTTYPVAIVAELDDKLELMEQFLGRFRRLGGSIPSTVYLMAAEGTIDERQAENLKMKTDEKNDLEKPGETSQVLQTALSSVDDPVEAARRLGAPRERDEEFDDLFDGTDDD